MWWKTACATPDRCIGASVRGCGLYWQGHNFATGATPTDGRVIGQLKQAGNLATIQGDYPRAQALLEGSLTLTRALGDRQGIATTLDRLAFTATRQGDARQARTVLTKSLALFQELRDMMGITAYLEAMAEVAELEGQPERLVRLFGAAVPLHSTLGMLPYLAEQVVYECQLMAARAQLGKGAYIVAWAAGQAMTVEQAIAYALETGQ